MIPTFPTFKRLDIEDKVEVQAFTERFAPYSDFNFVSLVCYDTSGDVIVSFLHGNLVLRLRDYMTDDPFYTFLGKERVEETIEALLLRSTAENLKPILRLVPAVGIAPSFEQVEERFSVAADNDGADYLLSVERLIALNIGELKSKKKRIEEFKRAHPSYKVGELDIQSPSVAQKIEGLCKSWQTKKTRSEEDVKKEFSAIRRCLTLSEHLDLVTLGIFMDDHLVAFNIHEILTNGHCMVHFGKAVPDIRGLGDALESETAVMMQRMNCSVMNYQQDLGLPGLRKAKQSWMPVGLLKKFTIGMKEGCNCKLNA